MNEIKNIFLPNKEILDNLNSYIKYNIKGTDIPDVWVGRRKIDNKNPMVVFTETRNEEQSRSTTYDNTTRVMSYNVDVFCYSFKNSYDIATRLATMVCEVMQGYYKMKGGVIGVVPTFDQNKENPIRINLRFTARFIPSQNKIY